MAGSWARSVRRGPARMHRGSRMIMTRAVGRSRISDGSLIRVRLQMTPATISAATGLVSYAATGAQLSNFNGYTDFTAMYDLYRIKSTHWRFFPYEDTHEDGQTQFQFITAVDKTKSTSPASESELLAYGNVKTTFNKGHSVSIYYNEKTPIVDAADSFVASESAWIDTGYATNTYWGLLYALRAVGAATTYMRYTCMAVVEFKQRT